MQTISFGIVLQEQIMDIHRSKRAEGHQLK